MENLRLTPFFPDRCFSLQHPSPIRSEDSGQHMAQASGADGKMAAVPDRW